MKKRFHLRWCSLRLTLYSSRQASRPRYWGFFFKNAINHHGDSITESTLQNYLENVDDQRFPIQNHLRTWYWRDRSRGNGRFKRTCLSQARAMTVICMNDGGYEAFIRNFQDTWRLQLASPRPPTSRAWSPSPWRKRRTPGHRRLQRTLEKFSRVKE